MKHLTILLALFLLIGCQNEKNADPRLKDKNVPVDFELGTSKDGKYTNKYFGLTFNYNKNWHLQTNEEIAQMMKEIHEEETDKSVKEKLEENSVNNVDLFQIFKEDPESVEYGEFNPSLLILAENISRGKSLIKNGKDYLEITKENYANTEIIQNAIGGIDPITIGSKKFHQMRLETDLGVAVIKQVCYAMVEKDFAFLVFLSYVDDDQKKELDAMVNTFKFK